jgi:hypothetical protein
VMRGRLDARRTLKSLVADLRIYTKKGGISSPPFFDIQDIIVFKFSYN